MSDITISGVPPAAQPPAPKRRKVKKRRLTPRVAAAPPPPPNEFAGITKDKCPAACTADHCVISTVGVCKHPLRAPASGCGPVTLANQAKALKIIKRQKIDQG